MKTKNFLLERISIEDLAKKYDLTLIVTERFVRMQNKNAPFLEVHFEDLENKTFKNRVTRSTIKGIGPCTNDALIDLASRLSCSDTVMPDGKVLDDTIITA